MATTQIIRTCEWCGRTFPQSSKITYAARFCSRRCSNQRKRRYVPAAQRPALERFCEKVDNSGPVPRCRPDLGRCWLWRGAVNNKGYGRFARGRKPEGFAMAHRWAYETMIGVIPLRFDLDHLCRTTNCVHPLHLEPVTHRANVLRGNGVSSISARRTHCKQGHEFTADNIYYRPSRPTQRCCRMCRERYQRIAVAARAARTSKYTRSPRS
jgi:hypothetical protein